MMERPILFSGEMVRAILAGRKTQTRRVVRIQPRFDRAGVTGAVWVQDGLGSWCFPNAAPEVRQVCPYGQPGDRLWVRETWCMNEPPSGALYRATDQYSFVALAEARVKQGLDLKWTPSIFMPRWASRITLEITKVRVERLQQISHSDATAEGCRPYCVAFDKLPAQEYRDLWDKINLKRGFGWDVNPWVWVIEFQRVAP